MSTHKQQEIDKLDLEIYNTLKGIERRGTVKYKVLNLIRSLLPRSTQ